MKTKGLSRESALDLLSQRFKMVHHTFADRTYIYCTNVNNQIWDVYSNNWTNMMKGRVYKDGWKVYKD